MAVTSLILRKRQGKETLTGGKRVRTYQALYHVKCNSLNEDPRTILDHPELPTLYPTSTWPTDAGALLVDRDPQQDMQMPDFWTVTLSYTSNPDIRTPPEETLNENPLLRPATFSRSPVQRTEIVVTDVDGNLVRTTAGELFNPPAERETHSPSFTMTKNLLYWPYALELALTDAINNDALIYISKGIAYPAYLVKCNGFSGQQQYENGYSFWPVSVALEVNWAGWNPDKINAGYREKFVADDDSVHLVPIIGSNGESVTEAVLLDEDGYADPFRSTPVTVPCKKHRPAAFSDLFALFGIT